MRSSSTDPFSSLAKICVVLGLSSLTVITLADRGATRMYAWPWSAFFWIAQVTPILALVLRSLASNRSLRLPSRGWSGAAIFFGLSVFVSALLSPYRGASVLYGVIPLGAVATFFLVHDWLETDRSTRAFLISRVAAFSSAGIVIGSLLYLAINLASNRGGRPFLETLFAYRNPHPLGHPSYTAGLALLTLPWLFFSARLVKGPARLSWGFGTLLALFVLVSTGSRGGLFGLVTLVLVGLSVARLGWRKWLALAAAGGCAALVVAVANPRTRAMFAPVDPKAPPNISNVQRSAMLKAGWYMGLDRPLFGWGPGVTSLVYPRYRHMLDGGVETALQLHDSPIQIWAELGAAGILGTLACGLLALRAAFARDTPATPNAQALSTFAAELNSGQKISLRPTAAATLAGYFVFALTDYQLDVPIFAFCVAVCTAILAWPSQQPAPSTQRTPLGAAFLAIFGVVVLFGHADPTPALDTSALVDANDPTKRSVAIQELNESLALNPDQEIAHFNLGWLLLSTDPVAAESHFLAAAHLVPDKGGVYYGLGLARASQGKGDRAARAFAVECINDPLFLTSPEWNAPGMESYRAPTAAQLVTFFKRLRVPFPPDRWPGSEVRYISALFDWLWRQTPAATVLPLATTPQRRDYFSTQPSVPSFAQSTVKTFRRERVGYPVLMRNLDIPIPVDLYLVNESTLASDTLRFLFPAKGWLPSPALLSLLSDPPSIE